MNRSHFVLLAKSQGQFKYSGKYYLHNGRWHKLHPDKPAPKHAPVSAHPHSAGSHVPKQVFTDAQWEQLKLPDSNVNAPSYNKKLAELKSHADAGDMTAILGSSFGTNTYGKKLSMVANSLLSAYGVAHKVTPGQKAGEHASVAAAPDAAPAAPAPAFSAPKPKKQFTFKIKPAASGDGYVIESDDGGGIVLAHKPTGFGILDNTPAKVFKTKDAALAYMSKKGMTPAVSVVVAKKDAALQEAVDHLKEDAKQGDLPAAEKAEDKALIGKLEAAQSAFGEPEKEPELTGSVQAPESAFGKKSPPPLVMPEFVESKTGKNTAKYYHKLASEVLDLAAAGDVDGLHKLKSEGLKKVSKDGKKSIVWLGTSPNSKLLVDLHNQAMYSLGFAAGQAEASDTVTVDTESSAKEGDTKQGVDGTLVLKNGRWHKMNEGQTLHGYAVTEDVNAVPLVHSTTDVGKAGILADGFKPGTNSMYGLGVYFSSKDLSQSSNKYDTSLTVSLKPHKQLVLKKDTDILNAFTDITGLSVGYMGTNTGREALIEAGIGSVRLPMDDGEIWTLVLDPALINVPADDAPVFVEPSSLASAPDGSTWMIYYQGKPWNKITKNHGNFYLAKKNGVPGFQKNPLAPSQKADLLSGGYGQLSLLYSGAPDATAKPKQVVGDAIKEALKKQEPAQSKVHLIPWDKQLLPDSNTNAPSHNKKVSKIKELAMAGDVAGLEAMKFGSNNYAKKQALLAQTAIAALKEDGQAPVAPAVPKKPVFSVDGWASYVNDMENHAKNGDWTALKVAASSNPLSESGKIAKRYAVALLAYYGQSAGHTQDKPKPEQAPEAPASNPAALSNEELVPVMDYLLLSEDGQKKIDATDDAALAGDITKVKSLAATYESNGGQHNSSTIHAKATLKKMQEKIGSAPAAPASSSWEFSDGEDSPTGYPTLTIETDNGWVYLAYNPDESIYEVATLNFDGGDINSDIFATLVDANKHLSALVPDGHPLPTTTDLKKLIGSTGDDGPQDGDTKPAADGGTLVFKDGHWHKQDEPAIASPFSSVEVPSFDVGTDKWEGIYDSIAKALMQKASVDGWDSIKGNITFHKDGAISLKYAGYHLKKITANSAKPRHVKMYAYLMALKAAAGKQPKTAKPKSEKVKAAPKPEVNDAGLEAIDSWQQTGGQGGSNPGGKFKDHNGVEWYCKFPGDADVAKSEVLAAKLYQLAGVAGQDAKLITKGGKLGIASRWVDVTKTDAKTLAKTDGVLSGFGVDCWLANWDVVGLGYDNLQIGADGKAVRIDAGGSLKYRAQGGKKAFGNTVSEIDSLRDASINPQSAAVFGKMTDADIAASVAKVLNVSDISIRIMVEQFGPGDAAAKKELADTLIARKADLAAKYPKAKKEKKAKPFNPEKISTPPSFLNWGNSGKPGPSSKQFLNEANENAVQAIYAAAKTGNIDEVKKLTAPTFNKDTGEITGYANVLEHPSQHVKGYAQQALNEINYQLNPPKRFRFEGGHPLHALNQAYPSYKGALQSSNVKKAGKFILLGDPGTISLDALALPKITHASGALSTYTYAKAAKTAIAQMPATQKDAVRSYTGNGYHKMNHSLWEGNPTGAAKSAAEALHTLGHEIAPGTVLSRKISVSGSDLDAILGTTGKIIQEPAIMSTSIRPSSWSGNVQLKMHVGPGVKGLWVGHGSDPSGGALSSHAGEDEMILPPNTRLLVVSVKKASGGDADGFGSGGVHHVVEAIVLPTA